MAEKERKDRIKALQATGQPVPVELTVPIRDPEKDPSLEDLESLEPHPSIAQLATELYTEEIIIPQIDPELLGRSQAVNYLPGSRGIPGSPGSTRESDIKGQEEEDDEDSVSLVDALTILAEKWTEGFYATDVAVLINDSFNQDALTLREFLYPGAPLGLVVAARSVGKRLAAHVDELPVRLPMPPPYDSRHRPRTDTYSEITISIRSSHAID